MNNDIKSLIEERYGIQIVGFTEGPRQFVAETHILDTDEGTKYFCKLIKQSKYTERTVQSLPILEQIHELGFNNINYPIKTKGDELYLVHQGILIILFNFIDAVQTFEYDNEKLGWLVAEIHAKTSNIPASIPQENFSLLYGDDFEKYFEEALNPTNPDKYAREQQAIISQYEEEIRRDWENFHQVIMECWKTDFNLVLTHGDTPGNVLVDSNKNIFLIDWDTILLAPAERDTWFLKDDVNFMNGYKSIFPEYEMNSLAYKFYLYNRYFEDMLGFIEEVLSDKSDEYKQKNITDLKKDCFDKWLRPLIRELN